MQTVEPETVLTNHKRRIGKVGYHKVDANDLA